MSKKREDEGIPWKFIAILSYIFIFFILAFYFHETNLSNRQKQSNNTEIAQTTDTSVNDERGQEPWFTIVN